MSKKNFKAHDVVTIYSQLQSRGIKIWLDGGWGVDALLGSQTRKHGDLDIIVQEKDVPELRDFFYSKSYREIERDDTSAWNFVLADNEAREVDVHVIVFDEDGNGIYGPNENGKSYPAYSLSGNGLIDDVEVKCLTAEYQVTSHTGYQITDKDFSDVSALCEKFFIEYPKEYLFKKRKLAFIAEDEYRKYRSDLDFWWPNIVNVLQKHNINIPGKREITVCGFNPTYPVFIIDNIVIKFFGYRPYWLGAFNTEYAAHEYLLKDDTILAPRILATGELFENSKETWPYIISTKIPGQSWLDANLTYEEKNNVAAEIGMQLRKIHQLSTDNRLKHDHVWSNLNFKAAASISVLPRHLVDQVDNYINNLDEFDNCFVNGDIVATHVFVENGHLSGIIDWGDATVTDKHYELGKLLDTFDWDKGLLKTVLEYSNWPVKKNFPRQSLGLALSRQAVGLTQHSSFDVFYKLPNLLQLESIATLDELADILFAV